jgi:hypothetical protein
MVQMLQRRTALLVAAGAAAAGTLVACRPGEDPAAATGGPGGGHGDGSSSGPGVGTGASPGPAAGGATPGATGGPAAGGGALPAPVDHAAGDGGATPAVDLVVRRLSYGATDGLVAEIGRLGVRRWIDQQLAPAGLPDDGGRRVDALFPEVFLSPEQLAAHVDRKGQARYALQAHHLGRAVWSRH